MINWIYLHVKWVHFLLHCSETIVAIRRKITGFVIYRCEYKTIDAWESFFDRAGFRWNAKSSRECSFRVRETAAGHVSEFVSRITFIEAWIFKLTDWIEMNFCRIIFLVCAQHNRIWNIINYSESYTEYSTIRYAAINSKFAMIICEMLEEFCVQLDEFYLYIAAL